MGEPADAHIIPKSFYLIDKTDKRPHKIISTDDDVYPEKSRTGIYDQTIVTAAGERYFLKWDDYAFKLLIENADQFQQITNPSDNKVLAYQIAEFDYHKLKMFFISLLWRAGVSSRKEFNNVNLGPHEDILKELMLNDDSGNIDDYAVLLGVFHDEKRWATIMSPFPERYNGIRCYRFYLGNIIAYIKVDRQAFEDPIVHAQMRPNQPLYLCPREFWGSKECKLFHREISKNTF